MNKMTRSAMLCVLRFLGLARSRRVTVRRGPVNDTGDALAGFTPFLGVAVSGTARRATARLRVVFRVKSVNLAQRSLIPRLSIPFFAGQPGFVSKTYLLNAKDRLFAGLYEWESEADAQAYVRSFAGRFMERNADRGEVRYEIVAKEYRTR